MSTPIAVPTHFDAPITFAEAEQLWTGAGGNPNVADQMAALATAESSRIANNVSGTTHDGGYHDLGLWQINPFAHPQYSQSKLLDEPIYNAAAAVSTFASSGPGAWSTYGGDAYLLALKKHAPNASPNIVKEPIANPFAHIAAMQGVMLPPEMTAQPPDLGTLIGNQVFHTGNDQTSGGSSSSGGSTPAMKKFTNPKSMLWFVVGGVILAAIGVWSLLSKPAVEVMSNLPGIHGAMSALPKKASARNEASEPPANDTIPPEEIIE